MERLKTTFILLLFLPFLLACTQPKNNKDKQQSQSSAVSAQEKEIVYKTVEEIMNNAEALSDKTVHVSGTIEHVCKHGGKRFKIQSADGKHDLKIELGEDLGIVEQTAVGSEAKVSGILKAKKMTAEMVDEWEKKAKKNHENEEEMEHFKKEIAQIQNIKKQIQDGKIPFYVTYSVQAKKYEIK